MNETKYPCALITIGYRTQQDLTYRAFADALNEHLVNTQISHTSVMNWEKGMRDPETDFLLICLVVYNDWRSEWANDCLCAKLPEVFVRQTNGRLAILSSRFAGEISSLPA